MSLTNNKNELYKQSIITKTHYLCVLKNIKRKTMKNICILMLILMTTNVFASCNRENNTIKTTDKENNSTDTMIKMKITIGNKTFTATFADTNSAKAFAKMLPLTLNMQDYGGFEKIATIKPLPTANKIENKLGEGDIMLYSGNTLVLFYANHGGYSYTRIGKIDNTDGLRETLGKGNVSVTFELSE